MANKLGINLNRIRKEKGMTQLELCKKCNLPINKIVNIEKHGEDLDFDTIKIIADALEVSPKELYEEAKPHWTQIMKHKHITQEQLADAIGVTRQTIINWAKDGHIPWNKVEYVASCLGVTPQDIQEDVKDFINRNSNNKPDNTLNYAPRISRNLNFEASTDNFGYGTNSYAPNAYEEYDLPPFLREKVSNYPNKQLQNRHSQHIIHIQRILNNRERTNIELEYNTQFANYANELVPIYDPSFSPRDEQSLVFFEVEDNSMTPHINSGNYVICDNRLITPRPGYIYLVNYNDILLLKMIKTVSDGYILHSSSKDCEDIHVTQGDDFLIIARVVKKIVSHDMGCIL